MNSRFDFQTLGYGAGLRPPHYSYIMEHKPPIGWFEIISENYMDTDGRPRRMLEKIRADYPVVMHGVSLSIGTVDPLNSDYLRKLKDLAAWVDPPWISDHLCWTGIAHKNTHDLLPVPYTEEALAHIIERIRRVQDVLDRPLVLENPSTYLEFASSSMPEWEFMARMAEGADCALLLDVNNIYVSCYNHRWNPQTYIDALPLGRVAQIHLAGHTNKGTHIVDTHDGPIIDAVWNLYAYTVQRAARPVSTMIEWDDHIPEFPAIMAEIDKAREWGDRAAGTLSLPSFAPLLRNDTATAAAETAYAAQLETLQTAILDGDTDASTPESWIVPKPDFKPAQQLGVYIDGYRFRLFDAVHDDYPVLRHYLGRKVFAALVDDYIEATPSGHFNICRYIAQFPAFVSARADEFAFGLSVLETQIARLGDAPETRALSPDRLEGLTPDLFMRSKVNGRAALALLPFTWNVNAYFNAVMAGQLAPEPVRKPSFVAVYRHEDTMWRLDLDEQEYMLLSSLLSGLPVEEALKAALPANDNEDETAEKLTRWFGRWMNNGLLASVTA